MYSFEMGKWVNGWSALVGNYETRTYSDGPLEVCDGDAVSLRGDMELGKLIWLESTACGYQCEASANIGLVVLLNKPLVYISHISRSL